MNQFDIIEGTYKPQRTDDLKPGAVQHIGRAGKWEAVWWIDEGPYAGQWALQPYQWEEMPTGLYWAPECDVEVEKAGVGGMLDD